MPAHNYDSAKYCKVPEALQISGFDNPYMRKLLKEGKISCLRTFVPNTRIPLILVDRASLAEYLEKTPRTQRKDGRNKYTVYANADELAVLEQVIKKNPKLTGVIVKRANPPKAAQEAE